MTQNGKKQSELVPIDIKGNSYPFAKCVSTIYSVDSLRLDMKSIPTDQTAIQELMLCVQLPQLKIDQFSIKKKKKRKSKSKSTKNYATGTTSDNQVIDEISWCASPIISCIKYIKITSSNGSPCHISGESISVAYDYTNNHLSHDEKDEILGNIPSLVEFNSSLPSYASTITIPLPLFNQEFPLPIKNASENGISIEVVLHNLQNMIRARSSGENIDSRFILPDQKISLNGSLFYRSIISQKLGEYFDSNIQYNRRNSYYIANYTTNSKELLDGSISNELNLDNRKQVLAISWNLCPVHGDSAENGGINVKNNYSTDPYNGGQVDPVVSTKISLLGDYSNSSQYPGSITNKLREKSANRNTVPSIGRHIMSFGYDPFSLSNFEGVKLSKITICCNTSSINEDVFNGNEPVDELDDSSSDDVEEQYYYLSCNVIYKDMFDISTDITKFPGA